jgi:hypothetical protein
MLPAWFPPTGRDRGSAFDSSRSLSNVRAQRAAHGSISRSRTVSGRFDLDAGLFGPARAGRRRSADQSPQRAVKAQKMIAVAALACRRQLGVAVRSCRRHPGLRSHETRHQPHPFTAAEGPTGGLPDPVARGMTFAQPPTGRLSRTNTRQRESIERLKNPDPLQVPANARSTLNPSIPSGRRGP